MAKLKFLSLDGLLEKIANKENIKIVDVLPPESYREGHVPGAINIPTEQIDTLAPQQLKKTDEIAVYCASYHCGGSTMAATALQKAGYKKVWDYKAGKKGWESAGLELVK